MELPGDKLRANTRDSGGARKVLAVAMVLRQNVKWAVHHRGPPFRECGWGCSESNSVGPPQGQRD